MNVIREFSEARVKYISGNIQQMSRFVSRSFCGICDCRYCCGVLVTTQQVRAITCLGVLSIPASLLSSMSNCGAFKSTGSI